MQETWARTLGWEDPLEKGMATYSCFLAWRIPVDRGAWWATTHGVAESDVTFTGLTREPHRRPFAPTLQVRVLECAPSGSLG